MDKRIREKRKLLPDFSVFSTFYCFYDTVRIYYICKSSRDPIAAKAFARHWE
jgi:hypothetical protein